MAPDYAIEIANAVSAKFPKKSLSVTNAIARVLPDEGYILTVLVLDPTPQFIEVPSSAIDFNLASTENRLTFRTSEKANVGGGPVVFSLIGSAGTAENKQFTQNQLQDNKDQIVSENPDYFDTLTVKDNNGNDIKILRLKNDSTGTEVNTPIMTDTEVTNVIDNVDDAGLTSLGFTKTTVSVTVSDPDNPGQTITKNVSYITSASGVPLLSQASAKTLQEAATNGSNPNLDLTGTGFSVNQDGKLTDPTGKKLVNIPPQTIVSKKGSDANREGGYTAP
jgi:hypothetical protein